MAVSRVSFGVFAVVALVLSAAFPAVQAQAPAPAPVPTSDGQFSISESCLEYFWRFSDMQIWIWDNVVVCFVILHCRSLIDLTEKIQEICEIRLYNLSGLRVKKWKLCRVLGIFCICVVILIIIRKCLGTTIAFCFCFFNVRLVKVHA